MTLQMQNAPPLHFQQDSFHSDDNILPTRLLHVGCANGPIRKRTCVKMRASGKTNIETVNGIKKVNGINIHVNEIPLMMNKDQGANNEYLLGRFVEDRFVYRQSFVIRSYEIGPDKTATMETLMNLLQETALNHVASAGVAGSGFGATREMSIRKLIWVVTRIHVQVDKYSSWYVLIN